jgi:hypothetical protein
MKYIAFFHFLKQTLPLKTYSYLITDGAVIFTQRTIDIKLDLNKIKSQSPKQQYNTQY